MVIVLRNRSRKRFLVARASCCRNDLHVTIFTIGKNEQRLNTLAKEFQITAKPCSTLEKAVKEIDPLHTKNSIAILSPAAASLDQFDSYAQRGEEFKKFVDLR